MDNTYKKFEVPMPNGSVAINIKKKKNACHV